jgi:hypothetical protein
MIWKVSWKVSVYILNILESLSELVFNETTTSRVWFGGSAVVKIKGHYQLFKE